MKSFSTLLIFTITISVIFSGCSKLKKTEAEKEREQWIEGFNDSISYYQNENKAIEERLSILNNRVNTLINNFEHIQNPKEVSGYYILKDWKNKIPLTTSGVYARINENEKLELIATLAGGTFNRLGIGINESEAFSETVPHDQAFNYRHQRYNTVYFSGGKADTIAQFISDNLEEKLNLEFIEGNKKKKIQLPENEKNMIAETWELYSTQSEIRNLQKELWINSKKIETFRRMMYMEGTTE